jgi:integrase
MLIANGENVKVVQELMRHSNSRTTLDVYSQARIREKREAQHRLVEMIMPEDTKIMMQHMSPDECFGGT